MYKTIVFTSKGKQSEDNKMTIRLTISDYTIGKEIKKLLLVDKSTNDNDIMQYVSKQYKDNEDIIITQEQLNQSEKHFVIKYKDNKKNSVGLMCLTCLTVETNVQIKT